MVKQSDCSFFELQNLILFNSQHPKCSPNRIVLGFIWLEAVFQNPSVASLYKRISTFCENMLHFSKLLN